MRQFRDRIVINKLSYYVVFKIAKYLPDKIFNLMFDLTIYKIVVIDLKYESKYSHLKAIAEELILAGTIVLVRDTRFITNKANGLIASYNNRSRLLSEAKKICSDYWLWRSTAHNYYRQIIKGCEKYKNSTSTQTVQNLVSIIVPTCRPQNIDLIIINVGRQSYFNLELIVVTQNYSNEQITILKTKLNSLRNLACFEIIEDNSCCNLGVRLNNAIERANGSFIAKMDDDDIYFDHYISDAMIPMLCFDCDIVGKKEIFIYLEGQDKTYLKFSEEFNCITDFVAGATFLMRKVIFESIQFNTEKIKGVDTLLLLRANELGYKIYSSDPFNFIIYRSKNITNHTWQISENDFLNSTKLITDGEAPFINV